MFLVIKKNFKYPRLFFNILFYLIIIHGTKLYQPQPKPYQPLTKLSYSFHADNK